MRRREALKVLGAVGVGAGTTRAVDNVLLGYGTVGGTNLRDQDLTPLLTEHIRPRRWDYVKSGGRLSFSGRTLTVTGKHEETSLNPWKASGESAREAEGVHDLPGHPVAEIVADLGAIAAGDAMFTFHDPDEFFDRVESAPSRDYTVDALRGAGVEAVEPTTIHEFTEANPASPRAVVAGLVDGFRHHTYYDVPRYAAGAVKYNLLFGLYDPREHFEEPVDFDSLLTADDETGMFCNEFTDRSLEALHALPAPDQTIPVAGVSVADWRHKHVYTGIVSVIRWPDTSDEPGGGTIAESGPSEGNGRTARDTAGSGDGVLEVATTFVDYTHTTLYDDFNLTGLLGEGLGAYNRRHRADGIFWTRR